MKRALAALLFCWLVLAASLAFGQTPTLVQSYTTSTNDGAIGGDTVNGAKITLPNNVGSGNLLVLQASYPNGVTISSISDTANGSWSTTPAVTLVGGTTTSSVFLFPNSAAGAETLTFTFSAAQNPVAFHLMEWNNIATSSPLDGHSGATVTAATGGTLMQTGSFTTTGTSGDLLLVFADLDGNNAGSNPTSWTAGASFTLHDADIAWTTNQGFPKASQYRFQSPSGAINPGVTITGDNGDAFNVVGLGLKVASAGTAPGSGIRIVKIIEESINNLATATWKLQFPTTGNLRLIAGPQGTGTVNFTGVTDSQSNTWTIETQSANPNVQAFFLQNASAAPTLNFTATASAAPNAGVFFWMYDIANAATSGQPGAVASTALTTASGLTSIANQPSITPVGSNDLIVAWLNNQMGPTLGVTAPSGARFDNVPYTGETDAGFYNFGNGWAHFYNSSTAAENWTWSITNQASNSVGALAIEFKTAPTSSCPPPSLALLGVGCLGDPANDNDEIWYKPARRANERW